MGTLEVRGEASRTVDYDIMKLELDFHERDDMATEASRRVMRESEDFLETLKKSGFDISKIQLAKDSVGRTVDYRNNAEKDYYRADRVYEIDTKINIKMINDLKAIIHSGNAQVGFHVDFKLSNVDEIRQELLTEALKDAKRQAEAMAQAIDQQVVGLISADKNAPKAEHDCLGEVLCMSLASGEIDTEDYDNSDKLSVTHETYTETIYTSWEIA